MRALFVPHGDDELIFAFSVLTDTTTPKVVLVTDSGEERTTSFYRSVMTARKEPQTLGCRDLPTEQMTAEEQDEDEQKLATALSQFTQVVVPGPVVLYPHEHHRWLFDCARRVFGPGRVRRAFLTATQAQFRSELLLAHYGPVGQEILNGAVPHLTEWLMLNAEILYEFSR